MKTQSNDESDVERLVRTPTTGYVSFDIKVSCPTCRKDLYLNQFPYDDDTETHNETALALFGSKDAPSKWHDLNIVIECCGVGCGERFILSNLEY